MSATANPFGLRPVYHPSGQIRPVATTITSGHVTNIFQYSPVQYIAATGAIGLAAVGARAVGVFMGVEYTPSDGRRRYSNSWPANQVATEIVAYITRDIYITYEIQATGPVLQDDIGECADWSLNDTTAGNTTTGLSNVALTAPAAAAIAGLQILGLMPYIDNAWGDAFTIVEVRIAEHQLVADSVPF
jgi:hypothetical protein